MWRIANCKLINEVTSTRLNFATLQGNKKKHTQGGLNMMESSTES